MTDAQLQYLIEMTERSLRRMRERLTDPPDPEQESLERLTDDLQQSLAKLCAEQRRRQTQA